MRLGRLFISFAFALVFLGAAAPAHAASFGNERLPIFWAAPFAGMLLSIALLPLIAPQFWHRHFGKISAFWAACLLLPLAVMFSFGFAADTTVHVLLAEFLPFTVILIALYTIAGGIYIEGNLRATPLLNTGILALGATLASIIGTTGASIVLIRPLLRANDARRSSVHVVVFFIFCVSNIGGALSPIGDPPLFLGFLKGVDFFWPLHNLWQPTLFCLVAMLAMFFALDHVYAYRERHLPGRKKIDKTPDTKNISIHGTINFALMAGVLAAIIGLARVDLGSFEIWGTQVTWSNVLRDVVLLSLAALSLALTPRRARIGNAFSWAPVAEVTKLFITIFITAVPVIAILRQGNDGALAFLTGMVAMPDGTPYNMAYFWLTGILSAFLDNAPTYLVFFELAGGDAQKLMVEMATTLAALSCGAVFMGAMSYIGNAPNFMVRSIAVENGVQMPSFFGYVGWAMIFLLPVLIVMSLIFFR